MNLFHTLGPFRHTMTLIIAIIALVNCRGSQTTDTYLDFKQFPIFLHVVAGNILAHTSKIEA